MIQRYDLAGEPWAIWRMEDGEYARFSDVKAEIEAAVQREREEIVRDLLCKEMWYENYALGMRDSCEKEHQRIKADIIHETIDLIKARGKKTRRTCFLCGAPVDSEPVVVRIGERFVGLRERYEKPGKIEKLSPNYPAPLQFELESKINELIDAVNEMRGRK